MTAPWQPIGTAPENRPVETAIIDANGERMTQTLVRHGQLWMFTDGSMCVYYEPTHWREALP